MTPAAHAGQLSAPAGWTPARLTVVPSTRRAGTIGAVYDAVRGVNERGDGQALTDVQVAVLAPFLARSFSLPDAVVRADLGLVRIYSGGASTGRGGWAVTLGRDLYVADGTALARMMSWDGRRWLAHELAHTMQWRRADASSDLQRTRQFMWGYVAATMIDPNGGAGAVPRGTWRWVTHLLGRGAPGVPAPRSLMDAIHDAHAHEVEAERVAQDFRSATEVS